MTNSFRGKRIWLIGASEGIGRSLAFRLAECGALLALSSRNELVLKELAGSLQTASLERDAPIIAPCDVRQEASVNQAFSSIMAQWKSFDILIYNAGYYEPMPAKKFDLPAIEAMVDVNLNGALRVLKNTLPVFLSAKAGHIALVGSIAGYRGLPNALGYGASKAALIHLAENLACDLLDTGIKVQIINPGFVKTRLTDKNNFHMPQLMTPEKASALIVDGLQSDRFEIRFPWLFSTFLKWARLLPARYYFRMVKV